MERRKLITLAACVAGAVFFFSCAGIADENKVIEEDYINKWRIDVDYNEDGRFRSFDGYSDVKIYTYRSGEGRLLLGKIRNFYKTQEVYLRTEGEWLQIGVIELRDDRRDAYMYFPYNKRKGRHIATYYEKRPAYPGAPGATLFGYTWIADCYYFKEGNYDHNLIPQAFFLTYRDSENIWGPEY